MQVLCGDWQPVEWKWGGLCGYHPQCVLAPVPEVVVPVVGMVGQVM